MYCRQRIDDEGKLAPPPVADEWQIPLDAEEALRCAYLLHLSRQPGPRIVEGARLTDPAFLARIDEWIMALARYGRQAIPWGQDLPIPEVWRQFKILQKLVSKESEKS